MLRRFFTAATLSLAVSAVWSQAALPPISPATEIAFVKLMAHAGV